MPIHAIKRILCHFLRDAAVVIHLGVVANSPQQTIDDAGRATRTPGDFPRSLFVYLHFEDLGGAPTNHFQVLGRIEVQVKGDSKSIAQRGR